MPALSSCLVRPQAWNIYIVAPILHLIVQLGQKSLISRVSSISEAFKSISQHRWFISMYYQSGSGILRGIPMYFSFNNNQTLYKHQSVYRIHRFYLDQDIVRIRTRRVPSCVVGEVLNTYFSYTGLKDLHSCT